MLRIKLVGGREVIGKFKGSDERTNIVLDDSEEIWANGTKWKLGLVVLKGSTVTTICEEEGFEEISNPYLDEE